MIPLLIAIGALAYAGAIVAFGRGPLNINSNIFGSITNSIGVLAPVGLYLLASQQRHTASGNTKAGVMWAVFGGVCISLFTIAVAYIFSTGKNVSFVTPLIYGGAVFLASIVGILVFKEKVTTMQFIGLSLIVAGIIAVAASSWKTGGTL